MAGLSIFITTTHCEHREAKESTFHQTWFHVEARGKLHNYTRISVVVRISLHTFQAAPPSQQIFAALCLPSQQKLTLLIIPPPL